MANLRIETRRAQARPPGRRDPAAGLSAGHGLTPGDLAALQEPALNALAEMIDERCLCSLRPAKVEARREQGYDIDAGFIDLPGALLDDDAGRRPAVPVAAGLGQVLKVADDIRNSAFVGGPDAFVAIGAGGAKPAAAALVRAFIHPHHNELSIDQRGGCPRIYFAGDGFDSVELVGLLDRLGRNPFVLNVISRGGTTFETAAAYRVLRKALLDRGVKPESLAQYIIAATGAGPRSPLQRLAAEPHRECRVLTLPEFVSGGFSAFTPAGLLPAAVAGLNVRELLRGASDMTARCLETDLAANPAARLAVAHHALHLKGHRVRVTGVWQARLETLGRWYDQLVAEALGKQGEGATTLTSVNTRDLHAGGRAHREGGPDRVFTHIAVERDEPVFYAGTARPRPVGTALPLPPHEPVDSLVRDDRGRPAGYDGLGGLAGRGFDALNRAAREGAASALRDADRPVLELILPDASEYHVGGLMQMLMIATVLEAKLLGVNPYGRNGAEPFTRNMMQRLRG